MDPIVIEHCSQSSMAGQTQAFETDLVRLGRHSDCEVVFHARKDLLVSARHAELRRSGDRLTIHDLGSSNGTFVNGRRIERETPVGPGDRVALGFHGPVITARCGQNTPPVTPKVETREGVGFNTLMRVVDQATSKERGKSRRLMAALLATGLLGSMLLWIQLRAAALEIEPQADFSALAKTREASVYVVLTTTTTAAGTVENGVGTAWSVAPGLLATNAHVAAGLEKLSKSQQAYARSSSASPHNLRIVGSVAHPGYREFQELLERYLPFDPNTNSVLNCPTPCDVALLEIDPRDHALQAAALELAPQSSLPELTSGAAIFYMGFPMEGILRGGTDLARPTASLMVGNLSKIQDVFLSRPATIAEALTLTYDMETAGGGSGSPVFGQQGRVIGLMAAINTTALTEHGRISTGGTTYGPRSDLIRELLSHTAEKLQEPRTRAWERRFHELFLRGVQEPAAVALSKARPMLREIVQQGGLQLTDIELLERQQGAFDGSGGNQATHRFTLPAAGAYCFAVVAREQPIAIRSLVRDHRGREVIKTEGEGRYAIFLAVTTSGRQELRLEVQAPAQARSSYAVLVFRAVS